MKKSKKVICVILASSVAAIFIIFLFFLASNNDKKAKFERDYNLKKYDSDKYSAQAKYDTQGNVDTQGRGKGFSGVVSGTVALLLQTFVPETENL